MLHSLKEIINFRLSAEDGEIGRSKDFLFDDRPWIVRYMVADTGKWLPGRKVLLSPVSLGKPAREARLFTVNLSKKQVENVPELDSDAPVSRQYEMAFHNYFGMSYYWSDPVAPVPIIDSVPTVGGRTVKPVAVQHSAEAHLRSAEEVTGYSIQATDGELGHVEDFILDDETWNIRYLVVATRNWRPDKKFLVAPTWLGEVDWLQSIVSVHMTQEQLKKCPTYEPGVLIDRDYEERLHDFHKRPKYWE